MPSHRTSLSRLPRLLCRSPLASAVCTLALSSLPAWAGEPPEVTQRPVAAQAASAAGGPAPVVAAPSKADPAACNAATDRANALDMKAAQAQAQKAESTQVAAIVDESIGQWQQAAEHCDGRAKERARRNLADSQRMRASLAVVQGAGEQCESTHRDAGALADLARQALSERRWADASVLFHKSEGLWDLASERCSGSMKDTALKRRDQTEVDAHNAEACAPRFDKAREVTQKFRSGSAALPPAERQKQSQIAETHWRELIPECKGSAQDIARNQADGLFRERGTPWVATRPADPASTVPVAKPGPGTSAATATAASTPPVGTVSQASTGTGAPEAVSAPPGMIDMVVANQTRLKGRFTLEGGGASYSGHGRVEWSNGDVYEGDVQRGQREGQGRFTWQNGQVYQGAWHQDLPHGPGRLRFADGNVYEGTVASGLPHGPGTYTWATGEVCTAQWTHGEAHGTGTLQFPNGNLYQGPLRNGMPHGDGEMRYASGDVYTGHFESGQLEGHGRYQWKNGDRFEGQWRAGLKEGPGVMTWTTGDRREGIYREDQVVGAGATASRSP